MVTMVTMGGDLQPGCLADRLLTDLGQPRINPQAQKQREKGWCSATMLMSSFTQAGQAPRAISVNGLLLIRRSATKEAAPYTSSCFKKDFK